MSQVYPINRAILAHRRVGEAVSVGRPVRADPQDFQGLAIVQLAGHRPFGDGYADELPIHGSAEGKLAASHRQVVPMVAADESVSFSEVKREGFHAVVSCRSVVFRKDRRILLLADGARVTINYLANP